MDIADYRSPDKDKLFGIRPFKVAYDPVKLVLTRDSLGTPIDIKIQLEMSGTYTPENLDKLFQAIAVARAIRVQMLLDMGIPGNEPQLIPAWMRQPGQSAVVNVSGTQRYRSSVELLDDLYQDETLTDLIKLDSDLSANFIESANCDCNDKKPAKKAKKKKKASKKKFNPNPNILPITNT